MNKPLNLRIVDSVRTNNFNDPDMITKISEMWARNEDLVGSEMASGRHVYAVYDNYAGNYKDDYRVSLAVVDNGPDNYVVNATFVEYPVASSEDGVRVAWKDVWRDEDTGTLKRRYTSDLEDYAPEGSIRILIDGSR